MNKLVFQTNVPVCVRLNSIEGKERESQFGPVQHLFTTDDGIFYVSETAGRVITEQCRKLGVRPGDLIEITKAEVDQGRGRKSLMWQVSVPVEEMRAENNPVSGPVSKSTSDFNEAARQTNVPHKPAAVANTAAQAAPAEPGWTVHLLQTTNALTTVLAAALQHANGLGAGIRPDDVRSIMLSAFINMANKSKEQDRVAA